ncbi:LysR family transcriptional regulator [Herbaspirillum rhizosphaerae]|uniref:LysR family transcriptional regulator n=1 Tax=Herbaspirillum rhizosphaerae TaxID=346179 RepID=UPI00067BF29B|nr:LysR family transcriptional regulator [Herbaspirillum rhizosphaerae]
MNTRQLEHLIAVSETGSFSRAAEKLFITQSALSRSLQCLEEELGGRLLDRIGKRNSLTPLGLGVVQRAREVVLQTSELRRSAQLLQQGTGGNIRVGMGSGPGFLLMTPLLCHVAQHHPDLRSFISRGPVELLLAQLREQQLDALVVDARRVMPHADLDIDVAIEMRTGFVCKKSHPLAARGAIGIDDILQFPVVSTPLSDEVVRLLVKTYGARANADEMITLQSEDIRSLVDTIYATDAVYLGILAAARAGLEQGELVELDVRPTLTASARFALVTLRGRTQAPVMVWFREFVTTILRDNAMYQVSQESEPSAA